MGSPEALHGPASGPVVATESESRVQAVQRALAAWAHALTPRTARRYGSEARAFLAFIERARGPFPDGLLATSAADCRAFVELDPALSQSSKAVRVAVLRSLLDALVVEGLIATNPAASVKVKHIESGHHHRAIPRSLVLRVLAALRESDNLRDIRDRALILTFLSVGARRSEVAGLKVGDLDRQEDGTAYLTLHGKGNKNARMLLRETVVRAIDKYLVLARHGDDSDGPLFRSFCHRPECRGQGLSLKGIHHVIKARFPGYSPHGLRARSITDVYEQSDLGSAQIFARHSSAAITERVYIQTNKLERVMRDYAPIYE